MIKKHNALNTTISPAMGLGLLACIFILASVITSVIVTLLTSRMSNAGAAVRISIVLQDILIFILPAVATAVVMTRLPARFLSIDIPPRWRLLLLAVISLFAAFPLLNCIVAWNEGIHLPAQYADIEASLRELENSAAGTLDGIMSTTSVPTLILSILIVGMLAGLSEELFFRGALQKLMTLTRINPHVAIWLTAFIFSAVHFQFFGFVPRMILGAYFGYLVWWTRCLWIPVIVHALNNSTVVVSKWIEARSGHDCGIDTIGADLTGSATSAAAVAVSIVLTAYLLYTIKRESK
ncbi:MAG: CPBP family intramembrane metalloprotease [Muribaculaceae bacterium]|nr:CPBP family intramembrane metalloprotease [Muribaculaceae bacterium]MDE6093750.1 CPBP family intramembrane metalloprotease [Muribaculaceae bacterium]